MALAPGGAAYRALLRRSEGWSAKRLAAAGPWLIIAPHADDETLGCGVMLSILAARGARARVAVLTDGARSHEGSPTWGPRRIASARRIETGHALRDLGVRDSPFRLSWPDARPHAPGSPAFTATVAWLASICARHRIRALAVSWGGEAHCDHEAAAAVAAALRARRPGSRVYDYLVWGWTDPASAAKLHKRRVVSFAAGPHAARQHRATYRHRTQVGPRIKDAATAFRLPPAMIALARRPRGLLLPWGRSHAA